MFILRLKGNRDTQKVLKGKGFSKEPLKKENKVSTFLKYGFENKKYQFDSFYRRINEDFSTAEILEGKKKISFLLNLGRKLGALTLTQGFHSCCGPSASFTLPRKHNTLRRNSRKLGGTQLSKTPFHTLDSTLHTEPAQPRFRVELSRLRELVRWSTEGMNLCFPGRKVVR